MGFHLSKVVKYDFDSDEPRKGSRALKKSILINDCIHLFILKMMNALSEDLSCYL